MNTEFDSLEKQLASLQPAALDLAFLDRLEACTAGVWHEPGVDEEAFEGFLASHPPAPLPPALADSIYAQLARVPFPQPTSIVAFPLKTKSVEKRKPAWQSAAALVAICGALAAFLVPVNQRSGITAISPAPVPISPQGPNASKLIPSSFQMGPSETSDEGVVWQSPDRPYRVIRVVFYDTVTLQAPDGHQQQYKKPRVEHILVPAKVD